jgi:hypothetical protein
LERAGPPRDRVLRCVYGRAQNLMDRYDTAMSTYLDRDNNKSLEEDLNDFERARRLF